ncbi:MAG: TrmH family RNA methyltransferase [Anaerolineales bacterium]
MMKENILQALEAGIEIRSVYFSGDDKSFRYVEEKITAGATIHEVAKRTTKKLFENDKLSRIFAIAETPKPIGLEKLNTITKDVVVLEDVSISGNIGNIIRTLAGVGCGWDDPAEHGSAGYLRPQVNPRQSGLSVSLPVMTATTDQLIEYCKQNDQTLLVTSADAEKSVDEIASINERLLIVFGSEKEGCSPEIENAASLKARIPINKKVESLNVSAAAGITLFARRNFNQLVV